jgi:type I restriction enzyme S subunit
MKLASSALSAPPREKKVVWQTKTIGDLCNVVNGGTPKTGIPEYWDGSNLWITPAEMGKRLSPYVSDTERKITDLGLRDSSARMLPPDSVILSSRAPIGHLVINTEPMATNQGCKGLIPSSQLQHKFLYYYLSSIVDLLNSLGTGTTFKELSGGKLKEVTIPLPSLPEQQRIVGILDEAFEGIATAKANAEKNLQNARALFESHLNSEHADKAFLGDLVNIKTGKLDANAAVEGGKYPFFTCSRDIFAIDTYAFDCEAILLAGNNAVGDFNVKHYNGKFNAYQRTYVITVNEKKRVLYRFLYFQLLKSLKKFKAQSVGAGTKFLKLGMIKDLEIALPSLDEQQRIVSKMDSVSKETERLGSIYERKLTGLEALKKSLLHKAFIGQL